MPIRVAHQIVERETVVRGQKVDASGGLSAVMAKYIARPGDSFGEFPDPAVIAPPEAARRVAVAIVPLRPPRREVAELIAAPADIPRLGDQLDVRERRLGAHRLAGRPRPV